MDANQGHGGPERAQSGAEQGPEAFRIELMFEIQDHINAALDDLARSACRDRPITLPNLRRLFARRWALVTWRADASGAREYRFGLAIASAVLAEVYGDVRASAATCRSWCKVPSGPAMTWSPRW